MTPVNQTILDIERGNCLPACLASILEVELDDVPLYLDKDVWLARYRDWLHERGWKLRSHQSAPETDYYLAQYPREGRSHVVICRGGEVVHDPHPVSKVSGEPIAYYSVEKCH